MKGFLLREYTKPASTKIVDGKEQVIPAHKVYVYGVDGTPEELQQLVTAKGDNIRYDDEHGCPLHFVSEKQYQSDVIDLVIYNNGKVEQDNSAMRRLKASTENRGGNFTAVINADANQELMNQKSANASARQAFLSKGNKSS